MRKWLAPAVILMLPAFATAAVPAVTAGPNAMAAQFAAVLQNPGHRQLVLESARESPAWTGISCAAARFAPLPEIGVYVPVRFDKTGEPISGEWREGVLATGCGAPVTLNVLTRITAPATLATGFLLPGTTIADPVLQNYAQGFALKAAGGLPAGCKNGFVADTRFTGYAGAGSPANIGPWTEIWTLDLCGPLKPVTMRFVPDASGTTIDAQPG